MGIERQKSRKEIWMIVAIVLATIICYAITLYNPFIWDQEVTILGNPLIRSWNNLPDVFKTDYYGERITGISFYRPLEIISYMVDYTFWKLNPFGYHLSSIFLHLCNALLIFWLLKKLTFRNSISFLAAFIFAIHPVNTETVTYSARGDMLAALFLLLCIIFFLYSQEGRHLFALFSIALYPLALLSKESAVVVPFIILIYVVLFSKIRTQKLKYPIVVLLLTSLIYISFRLGFISTSSHGALSLIAEAPLWQRLMTLPRILLTYIGLLIFPRHLHMEYHFVERTLTSPYVWLGALALILMGCAFVKYLKAAEANVELKRQSSFFLLWFLIGLAPFYNIIVTLHATLLEHWLYFSGIGFIVLMVILGSQLFEKIKAKSLKRIFIAIIVCLFAYYGLYTIERNTDWAEAMHLYQHDLKYEPNSFVLHNNVGVMHFRKGEFEKAKQAFLKAIEVSPAKKYEVAYNNVGVVYEGEGQSQKAEQAYKESIRLNNYKLAYANLSQLYLRQDKTKEAVQISEKGSRLYPLSAEINYCLALSYYYGQQFNLAKEAFEYLERIAPQYKDAHIYLEKIEKNFEGR